MPFGAAAGSGARTAPMRTASAATFTDSRGNGRLRERTLPRSLPPGYSAASPIGPPLRPRLAAIGRVEVSGDPGGASRRQCTRSWGRDPEVAPVHLRPGPIFLGSRRSAIVQGAAAPTLGVSRAAAPRGPRQLQLEPMRCPFSPPNVNGAFGPGLWPSWRRSTPRSAWRERWPDRGATPPWARASSPSAA